MYSFGTNQVILHPPVFPIVYTCVTPGSLFRMDLIISYPSDKVSNSTKQCISPYSFVHVYWDYPYNSENV